MGTGRALERRDRDPAPAQGWRARVQRLRAPAMRVALFAAGVAAAFLAILLYQAVTPKPHEVTTQEVNDTVAHAIASVTPLPAFSEGVYQVIQPSLVLIQAKLPGVDGKAEQGLGSGVIINDQGDILTALHVVTDATEIELTFADGSKSARPSRPGSRIRTSRSCGPASRRSNWRRHPWQSERLTRGRRGVCGRQSLRPV